MTDEEYATSIKDQLLADPAFFTEGRRNNDAVDLSIACCVLGLDPHDEVVRARGLMSASAHADFVRRLEIISRYLVRWEEAALFSYLVGNYHHAPFVAEEQEALSI